MYFGETNKECTKNKKCEYNGKEVKLKISTKPTSKIESDWTFFMFGTTRPYGVAMAIPILWEPMIIKK